MHAYTPAVQWRHPYSLVLGFAAGYVGGIFGVGGGIVVVPGLVLWMSLDQRTASGTSMGTIVASSFAALLLFGANGAVDWAVASWIFIGSGAGAFLAAKYLDKIPEVWLSRAFIFALLTAAVRMYSV